MVEVGPDKALATTIGIRSLLMVFSPCVGCFSTRHGHRRPVGASPVPIDGLARGREHRCVGATPHRAAIPTPGAVEGGEDFMLIIVGWRPAAPSHRPPRPAGATATPLAWSRATT